MKVEFESDYTLYGRLLLGDTVIENGAVHVENGIIKYSGAASGCPASPDEVTDGIIAPGFVDIHNHAGGEYYAYENPAAAARHHLENGTTGMLATFYRDLGFDFTLKSIEAVKECMSERGSNLLGVHLEGPYLNPSYGSKAGYETPVRREEYEAYAKTGVIRQWTYAPEVEGTADFLRYIVSEGIVPAIGHSAASPDQVYEAERRGARIVTHLFDATGSSISPARWGGTIETSFCSAALLCNNLYYEIICDRMGIHVRPDMVKLTIKTVGIEKIVGITDCCTGSADETDVNFVDGELTGSKLTMDAAARNFLALGLSLPEVFKVTSENPAKAIRMSDTVGSLREGRRGDVIVVDDKINVKRIIKANI